MTVKTFLLFNPETNSVDGTIKVATASAEHLIAHSNKIDVDTITFGENLYFDPVTLTLQGLPAPVEASEEVEANDDIWDGDEDEDALPSSISPRSWWRFW